MAAAAKKPLPPPAITRPARDERAWWLDEYRAACAALGVPTDTLLAASAYAHWQTPAATARQTQHPSVPVSQ